MKKLLSFALVLLLLCSCAAEVVLPAETPGAILEKPHPYNPDGWIGSREEEPNRYASALWSEASLVVVGRFLDIAPESRDGKPESTRYQEDLVYQFHVLESFKGDAGGDVIPVGISYGWYRDGVVLRSHEYIQPDAKSYKLLFLSESEPGDYWALRTLSWLTTDTAEDDWEQMDFHPDGICGERTMLYMDLIDPGTVDARPEIKGWELRKLCSKAEQETTAYRPIEKVLGLETVESYTSIDFDYWATDSLAILWETADLVVVGYYRDEEPITNTMFQGTGQAKPVEEEVFYEHLLFRFEPMAVLKGELPEEDLWIGPVYYGARGHPYETYRNPDANSVQVLFLNDFDLGWYDVNGWNWWLSTLPEYGDPSELDWKTLTYSTLHTVAWKELFNLDLPAGTLHESYTGAELWEIAEQMR